MSDKEYAPPSLQFQKLKAYEAKHAKQIVDLSWDKIPWYRKRITINLLTSMALILPYGGIIALVAAFAIWLTGPTYFKKTFGRDEIVLRYKKYHQPIKFAFVLFVLIGVIVLLQNAPQGT